MCKQNTTLRKYSRLRRILKLFEKFLIVEKEKALLTHLLNVISASKMSNKILTSNIIIGIFVWIMKLTI